MTLSDPVLIPGAGHANIMLARNDTVAVMFRIRHQDPPLTGPVVDTDVASCAFDLLIEWSDDILRVRTQDAGSGMRVETPAHLGIDLSEVACIVMWTPNQAQTDRIPVECAQYRLILDRANIERRTIMYGEFRIF